MEITEKTKEAIKALSKVGFETEEIAEMLDLDVETVSNFTEPEVLRDIRKFAREHNLRETTIASVLRCLEVRTTKELKKKKLAFCTKDQKVYQIEERSGLTFIKSVRNGGAAVSALLWAFYASLMEEET